MIAYRHAYHSLVLPTCALLLFTPIHVAAFVTYMPMYHAPVELLVTLPCLHADVEINCVQQPRLW